MGRARKRLSDESRRRQLRETWASEEAAEEIKQVREDFPVGKTVRIFGSTKWCARDRVLIGLTGTVLDVFFREDYTVMVKMRLDPNDAGRKWTNIHYSWIEELNALERLAAV